MANQYGINVGQLLRDVESIKGARSQNTLTQMKMDALQRNEAAAKRRQNVISGLQKDVIGGNQDAAKRLLALDPQGGGAFLEQLDKMDERQKAVAKENVETIGQMSAYVLNGDSFEEQQRRYALVYSNMSPEIQKMMPTEYNPNFVEMNLVRATTMDKLLEAPTVRQVGGEDVVYRRGREVERQTRPQKTTTKKTDLGGGVKSADESLIYRQAVELLGGIMDEQGNIRALDPEIRPKIQAIATEAAKIFQQEGTITRSEAVARAANKFGVELAKEVSENPTDPNNIRNFLLNN